MIKLLISIFIIFITSVNAQLGLAFAECEKQYGQCIDNGIPSPTGENWGIYYSEETKTRATVLFKDKKSIYIILRIDRYVPKEERKDILSKFEPGDWSEIKGPISLFISKSSQLYSEFSIMGNIIRVSTDKAFLRGDRRFQRLQKPFRLKRKPSFSSVSQKIESIGLNMKPDEVFKVFGEGEERDGNRKQYNKDGFKYVVRFDDKYKVSDKVVIYSIKQRITSKFLETIKESLSKKWEVRGDSMMSSDKKFVIVVRPTYIEVYSAKIAAKKRILDEGPTFHISGWCPSQFKDYKIKK